MPLSTILLNNVEPSLKEKTEEVSQAQTDIALFKMREGLLEAAPQALLQSSILFRDCQLFDFDHENWQIDLVTVTLSMVSMVMAWMTIYQKMPYFLLLWYKI